MKKVTVFTLMVLCGDFYFVDFLYFKNKQRHLSIFMNNDFFKFLRYVFTCLKTLQKIVKY